MKKTLIFYIAMTVFFFSIIAMHTGCEFAPSNHTKTVTPTTGDHYQGLIAGCKAHYNPMFCPQFLNPANLQADSKELKAVVIDKDGNTIILSNSDYKLVEEALSKQEGE